MKKTTTTTTEKDIVDILLESATNKVIAVDSGKNNMKAIYNKNAIAYKNKIDNKYRDSLNSLTWNINYNGLPYYVGDSASGSDLAEGKASIEHKIQTLTIIANYLDPEEENDDIVLIYGESLDYYFNEKHRQELIESLEGKHTISIMIDGELVEYNFTIKKAHIMPEGIGHIITNLSLRGKKYVVDIGGRTINFLTVENGAPVELTSFSEEMGIYQIASKCYHALKTAGLGVANVESVEAYIRYGCKNPAVQEIINETMIEHLKEFDDVVRKFGIDLHKTILNDDVIFVGGGTEAFKDVILEYYGDGIVISEDPLYSNVKGFYIYGLQRLGKLELN